MRSAGWLLFLLIWATIVGAQVGKDAKELLEAVAKRYDSAKMVAVSGTSVTVMKSPGTETKMTMTFSVLAQRPNKFRMVMEMPTPQGKQQQVIVSDGTNMFIEFPPLKQTLKQPAPKEGQQAPSMPFGGMTQQMGDFLKKVKNAQIVKRERLGKRQTQVIKATMEDGTIIHFWVADNLIWQTKVVMERKQAGGGTPSSPQGQPVTITTTVTFDKVNLNPKPPANTFVYKLPAGFKFVEKLELPKPPQPTPPAGRPTP